MELKNNVILQEEIKSVNHETGEIVMEVSKQTFKVEKEPSFVKLYLDDIAKLYDLPKGGNSILFSMVKIMGYDGYVVINKYVKKQIAKESGVSVSHVSNSFTKLIASNLLTRIATGIYQINPKIIAKGLWSDVRKNRIEYRL